MVINAAAWTQVDGAETNPDAAYAANALGPHYLAIGCYRCRAALVQISTNEVFAGEPGHTYREYDQPTPRGVYPRSKLAGEMAARQVLDRLYIVRVAWLFGPSADDFPSKIMAAANKMGTLRVVADECGNPTYAPDVADALTKLIQTDRYGIYHLVNARPGQPLICPGRPPSERTQPHSTDADCAYRVAASRATAITCSADQPSGGGDGHTITTVAGGG